MQIWKDCQRFVTYFSYIASAKEFTTQVLIRFILLILLKGQFSGADILLVTFYACEIWCCLIGSQCGKSFSRYRQKTVSTTIDIRTTQTKFIAQCVYGIPICKQVPTLQTHHVDSTLKRHGNDCFHIVSTWNPRGVFVGHSVLPTLEVV